VIDLQLSSEVKCTSTPFATIPHQTSPKRSVFTVSHLGIGFHANHHRREVAVPDSSVDVA
jgi:hypothetical protein